MRFESQTVRHLSFVGIMSVLILGAAPQAHAGLSTSSTTVDPQSTLFSASAQMVNLTAMVTGTGSCNPDSFGSVTFQVKDGMTNVGTAVTDTSLSAGAASVGYTLPAATAVGSYTIEASFTDGNFLCEDSMGTNTLTVDPASPSIVIVKNAVPDGPQDFSFSGDLGSFDLDDDTDQTLPNSMTFSVSAGTYTVTEAPVAGWQLTGLSCDDRNSTGNAATGTATIVADGTETVTCTFQNSQLGKLIVDKQTLPVGDPTSFAFELSEQQQQGQQGQQPVLDSFSLADQDPPYMTELLPGVYAVAEAVPANWELISESCDVEGSPDFIVLDPGATITCTFVNRTSVTSNLDFTKVFEPDTIGPGSVSTLRFTITNPDGTPADLLTFSDTLPAGLSIAGVPNPTSTCGGTVVAPAGGTTISFSGGGLAGFGSCTVSVDVTASTPGVYMNTSGELTSDDGIAGGTQTPTVASDDLTVATDRPGFSKSFAPSSLPLGDRSALTFTIDNSANGSLATFLAFTDDLPVGMEVADPANASNTCNGALTAAPGTGVVSLLSGFVAAMSTCTVTVDVVATAAGMLDNVSGELTSGSPTNVSSGKASDTLEVTVTQIALRKSFLDDPVPPGGTVTLEFTIDNFDRDDSATSIAFTDALPAGAGLMVSGGFPTDPCGAGSTLTGAMGVLTFSAGSLPAEGSCTFSAQFSVGGAPGIYANSTGAITADVGGSPVTGNVASDDLFVEAFPLLTKEFTDDPVNPGDSVTLEFTITNTSADSTLSNIFFEDIFSEVLPTASSVPSAGFCNGTGTATFTSLVPGFPPGDPIPARLEISDASLAAAGMAGDSCSFSIVLDVAAGAAPGLYPNTTSEITGDLDFFESSVAGPAASDGLVVIAAPQLTKAFTNDPVAPGGTVTLEFTLSHLPDAAADATGITFTDDLTMLVPSIAGLTANLPPMPDPPCGAGSTLTGSAGDTLLTLMGGTLMPGESCVFSVTLNVPADAAAGSHTNTTSGVAAMVGGVAVTSAPATADLEVAGLTFKKEFLGDPVLPGATVTLRFTIENVHPTDDATGIGFTDSLSAVLPGTPDIATTGPPTTNTCGGSESGSSTNLFYTGGSLMTGQTCTIEYQVSVPGGAPDGTFTNTTNNLSATQGGGKVFIAPATDDLVIDSNLLSLTKEFTDDPVAPGDNVTLEFTLLNLSATETITDISFSDNFDDVLTGLAETTGMALLNECAGMGNLPTSNFMYSGVTLGPGASCKVRLSLTVPGNAAAGVYPNTTSAVSGLAPGETPVSGDPASDDLEVLNLLLFSKSFDGPTTVAGTPKLTFTITNPGSLAATEIAFSDNLDDVLTGLVATGLPLSDICGEGSQIAGTSFLTFTGGSVPPMGGMCSFDVDLLVPGMATPGTFPNTTSDLSSNGLKVADPATADLEVVPPPTFAKAFAPDSIGVGQASTLTFTIDNTASPLAASSLALTDNLPAGTEVASPANVTNTCGGTSTAAAGTGVVSLTGGSVGEGATCTLTVDVTGTAVGAHVNTSGDLTSSSGNSGSATDTLTVVPQPGFAKSFAPDTIGAGGTSTLTFTIDNTASTVAATALDFTDNLPAAVTVATPSNATTTCTGGTLTAVSGAGVISYTGGSVAAGSSCVVEADVTSSTPGSHVNTTGELTSSLGSSGTATDTLTVNQLSFGKVFAPGTIGPGSTALLRFDIVNTSTSTPAQDLAFTDVLPAGVVIATPASAATDCVNAVLTAPDGGTTITLSGAGLGTSSSCSVSVNVTAASAGSYDNVSGDLTSNLGNSGPATATLIVDAGRPGFSKGFSPSTIPPGGTSTLTLLIDNTANAGAASQLSFLDTLPTGLAIAVPANLSNTCGGTVTAGLSADGLSQIVALDFGFVGAASSCTVSVDVTAAAAGTYVNTSGELLSGVESQISSGFATAALEVAAQFLAKRFSDDPVPPGGTVTLKFTITNPSRDFSATGISFSDDLDATLSGLLATGLPIATCGGTLTTPDGGMTVAFSGGSLPPEGSCTLSVSLSVPGTATDGGYTNTTTAVMATIDGAEVEGNVATDKLFVSEAPILTKEFTDDPVGAGGVVTLEFTITNVSDSTVTDITFEDEFDVILPTSPSGAPATGFCGPGSTATFTPLFDPGTVIPATLLVSGASLDPKGSPGDSCTFSMTLDVAPGAPAGVYPNVTSEISATLSDGGNPERPISSANGPEPLGEVPSGIPVIGQPASDDLVVVGPVRLTKDFTDDPALPGGTVTLEFTIEHDAPAPSDAVMIEFTDDLVGTTGIAGLAANDTPKNDICGIGSMLSGATNLSFTGGTLAPGETCTFSVTLDVPAAASPGSYQNETSNVVATVSGVGTVGNKAQAELVVGGLTLTKQFTDDPVVAGGTVMLEFVVTNQSPNPVTDIFFEDALDPDVVAGLALGGALPADPCGADSELNFGAGVLTFSGGSLPPTGGPEGADSCSFSVPLLVPLATPSGTYPNRTRLFSAVIGTPPMAPVEPGVRGAVSSPVFFPNATDDLIVANEDLLLTKEFTNDPVAPGGTVTLVFSLSSLSSDAAMDLAFTDDLGAALAGLTALPPLDPGTCGGTLSGTSVLTFSGGSFASSECSFSVTVQVPAAVPFGTTITNTTSTVTGTIGGLAVTGEPASDDLMIDFFDFTKFFDGLTRPTGTPTLTFTIENLSTMDSVSDLAFTDNLDDVIPGLTATGLPASPCGPGSVISGTSLLTFSGGNLLPGGSCTFAVDLLVPADSGGGTFLNTTSDLFQEGISVSSPATALLAVDPPPTLFKFFLPDFIASGGRSALTLFIDNSASTFAATDIAITDNLPAGMTVATSPDIGTDCAGAAIMATPGSSVVGVSGGQLPAGGDCVVQVDVTATAPGSYANTTEPMTSSSGTSAAATDTLVVVMPGDCSAPNGEDVTLQNATVVGFEEFIVCNTITVGPDFGVVGPNGDLVLRAGVAVVFQDGFTVGEDGSLTVSIEPVLIP